MSLTGTKGRQNGRDTQVNTNLQRSLKKAILGEERVKGLSSSRGKKNTKEALLCLRGESTRTHSLEVREQELFTQRILMSKTTPSGTEGVRGHHHQKANQRNFGQEQACKIKRAVESENTAEKTRAETHDREERGCSKTR